MQAGGGWDPTALSCLCCALLLGLSMLSGCSLLAGKSPEEASIEGKPPLLLLQISGGDEKLQKNIRGYLPPLPTEQNQLKWFINQVEEQGARAAEALGYYRIQLDTRLDASQTPWVLYLDINEGEPVRLTAAEYTVLGEGQTDTAFDNLIGASPLQVGSTVDHEHYQLFKQFFSELALNRGYFDARWEKSGVTISQDLTQAELQLTFNTGPRYQYGEIVIGDSPFNNRLLRRFLQFDTGDYFYIDDISRSQADMIASGYFSRVAIAPQTTFWTEQGQEAKDYFEKSGLPPQLPIIVDLAPAKRNQINVGAGLTTDRGPNLTFNWVKPWVNRGGHSFRTLLELGFVRQRFIFGYRIPQRNPLREHLNFDLAVEQEDVADISYVRAGPGVNRNWLIGSDWLPKLFIWGGRELYDQLDDEGEDIELRKVTLLVPGVGLSRYKADSDFYPYNGSRFQLQLQGASDELASDISFIRPYALLRYLKTLANKWRLFGRLELGTVASDPLTSIPPSYRFYAGGDQSIRGYDYQRLGPKENGKVVGGRNLTVGSMQFGYVFGNWEPVLFTDAGAAWTYDFDEQFRQSVGGGIHWRSPIGAVRLVIAFGLIEAPDDFRIHIALGPEL